VVVGSRQVLSGRRPSAWSPCRHVARASPLVRQATALQQALSAGAPAAAVSLPSFDALFGDMPRTPGSAAGARSSAICRTLRRLPHGPGTAVAHVVDSTSEAATNRTPPTARTDRRGHTAIELDPGGQISRVTAVYDSGLFTYAAIMYVEVSRGS
jgi:hypothetical protein